MPNAAARRSPFVARQSPLTAHRSSPVAHRPSPIARQSHPDDRMAMTELARPVSSALSPSPLFVPGCGKEQTPPIFGAVGYVRGFPSFARCFFPKPRYLKGVYLFDYCAQETALSPNDGGPIPNTAPGSASSWFWFARTHRLVRVDAVGSLDLHDVRGADCLCGPSFPWLRRPPQILSERQRQSLPRARHGPPLALCRCPRRRRSRRSAPRARATRYGRLVPFDPFDPFDPVVASGLVGAKGQGEHQRGHLAHCKRRVSGGAHDARV